MRDKRRQFGCNSPSLPKRKRLRLDQSSRATKSFSSYLDHQQTTAKQEDLKLKEDKEENILKQLPKIPTNTKQKQKLIQFFSFKNHFFYFSTFQSFEF